MLLKHFIAITIILSFVLVNPILSQEVDSIDHFKRHQLKVNLFYLGLESLEVSYEYTFVKLNTSIGFSVNKTFSSSNYHQNLYVTQYYRIYMGEKKARGLYIEGHALMGKEENLSSQGDENNIKVSFGVAIGTTVLYKRIVIEPYIGIGRILNPYDYRFTISNRLGINLGFTF